MNSQRINLKSWCHSETLKKSSRYLTENMLSLSCQNFFILFCYFDWPYFLYGILNFNCFDSKGNRFQPFWRGEKKNLINLKKVNLIFQDFSQRLVKYPTFEWSWWRRLHLLSSKCPWKWPGKFRSFNYFSIPRENFFSYLISETEVVSQNFQTLLCWLNENQGLSRISILFEEIGSVPSVKLILHSLTGLKTRL